MALDLSSLVNLDGLSSFLSKADERYAAVGDVPTDTSDLTNGAGYLTSADVATAMAAAVASALEGTTWADLEGSNE